MVIEPSNPKAEFMGWFDSEDNIVDIEGDFEDNITLYPKYLTDIVAQKEKKTEKKHIITFNMNGGIGNISKVEVEYEGQLYKLKTLPKRTGYTFLGFYDNKDYNKGKQYYSSSGDSIRNFDKASNTTLYAVWSKNEEKKEDTESEIEVTTPQPEYTVKFNANGGSGGQSTSVKATLNKAMPAISTKAPTRSGYTFMGWYDNKDFNQGIQYYTSDGKGTKNYDVKDNIKLYAGWSKNGIKLKVATFNVAFFSCGPLTKYSANCKKSEIVDFIADTFMEEEIDLAGFQEARDPYDKACNNNGGYCYYNRVRCGYEFGNMPSILKKLGVDMDNDTERNKHFVHTCPYNVDAVYSRYAVDTSKTMTGSLGNSRTWEKVVVTKNGVTISFYNTHLGLNNDDDKTINRTHWTKLANVVKDDPNPVIITGDFNYSDDTKQYDDILKPLGFIMAAHDDSGQSMNTYNKSKKDDYMDCIFVRPYGKDKVNHIGVDPKKSKTIVTFKKYSDHNLVIAELTIY